MDISKYLKNHENKGVLKILTCGSVDDGKSTLIGRLLYDSHMIYDDQLSKLMEDSKNSDDGDFNPALLTDGLKAEREQGITIDVAYRYFSTEKRKFIIADCPGHEQYTRNMVTGASNCDLAVILIDARHGVIDQTKRHSFICSLLGIKNIIVAVNKMDLVDWNETIYNNICEDYKDATTRLQFLDPIFIPMSALDGDNVTKASDNSPWYTGGDFLGHIETINTTDSHNLIDMRFPVQNVLRPNQNFRGFSGTLASGCIKVGDEVCNATSKMTSRIKEIHTPNGLVDRAIPEMALTLTLEDEIDISRGDVITPVGNIPHVDNEVEAMVVWMDSDSGKCGTRYNIKHMTNTISGQISDIRYKMDINTMTKSENNTKTLELNEISRCRLKLQKSIAHDEYNRNKTTGSFIIIDKITNNTVGAGMIIDRISNTDIKITQTPSTYWLTGLPCSGKTTIAKEMKLRMDELGYPAICLDGDDVRDGLCSDLGFSEEDRKENLRRISHMCNIANKNGVYVLASFVSPTDAIRSITEEVISELNVIHVDTPLEVCEKRDTKGMYKLAREGKIPNFTGVDGVFEIPHNSDMQLNASGDVEDAVDRIMKHFNIK